MTSKEPVGVVGQIIPWNYPLLMVCRRFAFQKMLESSSLISNLNEFASFYSWLGNLRQPWQPAVLLYWSQLNRRHWVPCMQQRSPKRLDSLMVWSTLFLVMVQLPVMQSSHIPIFVRWHSLDRPKLAAWSLKKQLNQTWRKSHLNLEVRPTKFVAFMNSFVDQMIWFFREEPTRYHGRCWPGWSRWNRSRCHFCQPLVSLFWMFDPNRLIGFDLYFYRWSKLLRCKPYICTREDLRWWRIKWTSLARFCF